jgi:hypothetical protein
MHRADGRPGRCEFARRRAIGKSSTTVYARHIGSIGGDLVSLDKSLRKLISKG